MNPPETIASVADALLTVRLRRSPTGLLQAPLGLRSATEGYAAQHLLVEGLRREGAEIIGFKLGLTDLSAQTLLGHPQPLVGRLLQGAQYWSSDIIPINAFMAPRVEPEIAFIISRTLGDPEMDEAALLRGVGGLVAALEICDSSISGWPSNPWDALADNLCAGGFVMAREPAPATLDLANVLARLKLNGQLRSEGAGSQCMGSPTRACLWLARELARQGTPLRAGDIVLTGALGPMQTVGSGDVIEVEIQGVGGLRCRFV
jgi:2-keto-4-pentenoate hydratase